MSVMLVMLPSRVPRDVSRHNSPRHAGYNSYLDTGESFFQRWRFASVPSVNNYFDSSSQESPDNRVLDTSKTVVFVGIVVPSQRTR